MAEGGEVLTENAPQSPVDRFVFPLIQDNPNGWGPIEVPEQFKDTPYQPFSKDNRLGKVADWTNNLYQDRRTANKYGTAYGAGQSQMYIYHHEQDESTFHLVDSAKPQRPMHHKPRGKQMQSKIRRDREKREERKMGGRQHLPFKKNREKERRTKKTGFRTYHYDRNPPVLRDRAPSVDVRSTWRVVREINFNELSKLNYTPGKPEDMYVCGSLGYFDVRKEKSLSVKHTQRLARNERSPHTITTSSDPIIQKLAKENRETCKVFATDEILATLMACTRSRYSWDIIAHRYLDTLFFDKRDNSRFDYLTVDETAKEPPQEEQGPNTPQKLSVEATIINQSLTQQLLQDRSFNNINPLPFEEEASSSRISRAYRYRKYTLSDGHGLVVRCKLDAVFQPDQYINVKALNEWDPKYAGGNHVDWRQGLERQRGAVFATELKNNSCKIAKWAISAILAGSAYIKFGYVSRTNPKDPSSHEIMGFQTERPDQLASQLTLDINNAWGILHGLIDYCREQPPGKYLIMKDPNKQVVRIYHVSDDEFESSSESESEGYQSDNQGSD